MIMESREIVTLVGAGAATSDEIRRCQALGQTVVAADGGAEHCLKAGILPDAVIGDMDSLNPSVARDVPADRIHKVAEQDSTDFDKALRNIKAPLVLGVGFTGARMDHQLACYNALVRRPHSRCILLSDTDIAFLAPPRFAMDLPESTRVSLFPLGLVEGVSDGLKWPIGGLTFTPDGVIGTSNEATGPIDLTFTGPKMLIILPKEWLEPVTTALAATAAHWPAL